MILKIFSRKWNLSYCTNEAGTDTCFQHELGFFSFSFPASDLAMVDLRPKAIKGEQRVQGKSCYHSKACA